MDPQTTPPHDLSTSCAQTSTYDIADSKLNTSQWLRATVKVPLCMLIIMHQVSSMAQPPAPGQGHSQRLATPRGPGPICARSFLLLHITGNGHFFFGHLRFCATNWLTYRSLMCKNCISQLYPATDPWILEVLLAMTEPVCHSCQCTHYEGWLVLSEEWYLNACYNAWY